MSTKELAVNTEKEYFYKPGEKFEFLGFSFQDGIIDISNNTLKQVDGYMQEQERFVVTGVHNKKNLQKVPYDFLKKCNYKSLVNKYHKSKKLY